MRQGTDFCTESEKPAIFGGKPARETAIHYGRQYVDDEDIAAVTAVLRSPELTCGPHIARAEKALCQVTGAKYAVAVSSGTAALHLAAIAAGLAPGDEVITTPITFAASANCALYCGARPVFADICPDTYNIDPESVRKCVTERTRAVVAVDFTGQAADYDALLPICRQRGLTLIEDSAHAIGTRHRGRPVGSFADMTCFSFHPVKSVTSGEGGAVTTNDEGIYRRLLRLRQHGITRNREEMSHPSDDPWYQEQVELGYNYRMTDMQAALLTSQLQKLPAFAARRRALAARYDAAFGKRRELLLQREIDASDTVRHLYLLHLNPETAPCTRREMFDALCGEGIIPQVHYTPVYWHPYYEKLGYPRGLCPRAEALSENILSLPLYYSLTEEDVDGVIGAVNRILDYYAAVR